MPVNNTRQPEVLVQLDLKKVCEERERVTALLENGSLTKEEEQTLKNNLSDLNQAVERQTELCREVL